MENKRVCDNCRYFHQNASMTREWCYLTSEESGKIRTLVDKYYVDERINGNKHDCRYLKKL